MHLLVYWIQKVQQWFWRSPKKGSNCSKSLRTVRRRHFLLYKGYNVLLKKTNIINEVYVWRSNVNYTGKSALVCVEIDVVPLNLWNILIDTHIIQRLLNVHFCLFKIDVFSRYLDMHVRIYNIATNWHHSNAWN